MRLIIASNNQNKVNEIKNIFNELNMEVLSLKDVGVSIEVLEDGETIEENSYKKAFEIYNYLKNRGDENFYVLSDDSGLMIDALNGAPGVISARFSGENSTSDENNKKVLTLMENVCDDERGCRFVTVLTLIDNNGEHNQFEGILEGSITREEFGENGFGYDPIFYVEEFKKTLAQITQNEKNSISHRFKALEKARLHLMCNKK